MKNIRELKAQNIEKRKNNEQKLLTKLKHKEEKARLLDQKHESFANKYSKIKIKKLDKKIKEISKKYNTRIQTLKEQLESLPRDLHSKELDILKNSYMIKYYEFRISLIKKIYEKKIKKITHSLSIAKYTDEEAQKLIHKLRIDEGSIYERWDQKLIDKKNNTSETKIKQKIQKLETLKTKEITSLEKRKESTPPNNYYRMIHDIKENIKATSINGVQVGDVINKASAHIRKFSMFYILAIIIAIFAIGTHGTIIKSETFMTIINGNTYILIIGLAMLLIIVAGYIDLSVGSLLGFMGAMSVMIYNQTNGNIILTLLLVIVLGMAIGFVQGVLIGHFKMPAFIVTLGTMLLFQGLILTVTQSKTLQPVSDLLGNSSYIDFVIGAMPDVVVGSFHIFGFLIVFVLGLLAEIFLLVGRNKKIKYGLSTDSTISFSMKMIFILTLFSVLGYYVGASIKGLRYYLIYIMVLIVVFIFVTQNTSFGRKIYAIGGNKRAAVLSGISVSRTTIYIFVIAGALVGFASVVFTAISSSAAPGVSTRGYELDVISAVFVGGASMAGGIGTVPGTVIGGLILGYINVGMYDMNFQADMQKIIKAIVLLGAVGYDIYSNRKIG